MMTLSVVSEFQLTFFPSSEGISVWRLLKLGKHVAMRMSFTLSPFHVMDSSWRPFHNMVDTFCVNLALFCHLPVAYSSIF